MIDLLSSFFLLLFFLALYRALLIAAEVSEQGKRASFERPGFFRCFHCGITAYLIRGFCENCAPDIYEASRKEAILYQNAAYAFIQATGKEPLEDWYAFERFLEEMPEVRA